MFFHAKERLFEETINLAQYPEDQNKQNCDYEQQELDVHFLTSWTENLETLRRPALSTVSRLQQNATFAIASSQVCPPFPPIIASANSRSPKGAVWCVVPVFPENFQSVTHRRAFKATVAKPATETAIKTYGHSSRARLKADTDDGICAIGLGMTPPRIDQSMRPQSAENEGQAKAARRARTVARRSDCNQHTQS